MARSKDFIYMEFLGTFLSPRGIASSFGCVIAGFVVNHLMSFGLDSIFKP